MQYFKKWSYWHGFVRMSVYRLSLMYCG